MNFGEMTNRVKYTLGMEDIATNDEVALAQAYLNEGVVDVLVRTRPYTRCINLKLTANTAAHDVASQVLWLLDIQLLNGDFLDRLSREDVIAAQKGGARGFAYEEPMLWVSPMLSEDGPVKAYGGFRPAPMVGPTDDASNPDSGGLAAEFHPAVVNYALWKGGEYLQHEQSAGGERWRVMYEGQDGTGGDISRIKKILTKRVTAQGAMRRDLTRNLGALSESGALVGG